MKKFKLIATIVIALIIALFLLQNLNRTDIIFLVWTFTFSKALLLLGSLIVGFLIGIIAMFSFRKKS